MLKWKLLIKGVGLAALLLGGSQAHANKGDYGHKDEMNWSAKRAALDLQRGQMERLERAEERHRKAVDPIKDRKDDAMDSLKELVDRKAGDADLERALERLKDAKEDLREEERRYHEEIMEILTPRQRARLALSRHRGGMHDRPGMGGDYGSDD